MGEDLLSMALTRQSPALSPRIEKWAQVRRPRGHGLGTLEFSNFLKQHLDTFLLGCPPVDIWTAIDANHLKLRVITIPNLPSSKLANAAFWGLKKELQFDDASEIFDFKPLNSPSQEKKLRLLAFTGDKTQTELITKVFKQIGYPLTGITAHPFAMQNFIRSGAMEKEKAPIGMVHIDRKISHITCFSGENILLARNIKTGSQSLMDEYLHSSPGMYGAPGISMLKDLDPDHFQRMAHAAGRLTNKIKSTGDYFAHNLTHAPISRFYLSGEMDECPSFMDFAKGEIPFPIEKFAPFGNRILPSNIQLPDTARERKGMIPALGIALACQEKTPNFLYTHVHENQARRIKKLNGSIAAVLVTIVLICTSLWGWFTYQEDQIASRIAQLEYQTSQYATRADEDLIVAVIEKKRQKAHRIQQYILDYLPLAVIREVCHLTTEKMDIFLLDANFPPKNEGKAAQKTLTLKATITDTLEELEPSLTKFVVDMGESPMFKNIILTHKKIQRRGPKSTLEFSATMEVL